MCAFTGLFFNVFASIAFIDTEKHPSLKQGPEAMERISGSEKSDVE